MRGDNGFLAFLEKVILFKKLKWKPVAMAEVFRSMSELSGTRHLSGL